MIVYNQAYDLYYTIFRLLHILDKIDQATILEIERLRIWDFYLLFPNVITTIKFKQNEKSLKKMSRELVGDLNNPYEQINELRKIFEKIKPYQLAALNCIASYGVIDKTLLNQQRIAIINKKVLSDFVKNCEDISSTDKKVINYMVTYFSKISLFGTAGLKNKTNLMESKYDAQ